MWLWRHFFHWILAFNHRPKLAPLHLWHNPVTANFYFVHLLCSIYLLSNVPRCSKLILSPLHPSPRPDSDLSIHSSCSKGGRVLGNTRMAYDARVTVEVLALSFLSPFSKKMDVQRYPRTVTYLKHICLYQVKLVITPLMSPILICHHPHRFRPIFMHVLPAPLRWYETRLPSPSTHILHGNTTYADSASACLVWLLWEAILPSGVEVFVLFLHQTYKIARV